MKKKIRVLFVTSSTGIGGSEQVLKTILKQINKERFNVSLLSITDNYNDEWYLKGINCIKRNQTLINSVSGFKKSILASIKGFCPKTFLYACKYKYICYKHSNKQTFVDWWEAFRKYIQNVHGTYDIAIAFGTGKTIPIVLEKVSASKKIVWVNNDVLHISKDYTPETELFYQSSYQQFDLIVTVTDGNTDSFLKKYGGIVSKDSIVCIHDLFDKERIFNLSREYFDSSMYSKPIILTVGRFSPEKGYNLLLDAGAILKNKGYCFSWLIIGNGDYSIYQQRIEKEQLEENIKIIGALSNPYPCFSACDIYVQTSLHEGNCLTLLEAMAFCKPCVTTNFPTGVEKIKDEVNGLVADMNGESISRAVERLIINKDNLRKKLSNALASQDINTDAELNKIESLFISISGS